MIKRHPKTKEILEEMEEWAKKKDWAWDDIKCLDEGFRSDCDHDECKLCQLANISKNHERYLPWYLSLGFTINPAIKDADDNYKLLDLHAVMHFIPTGCKGGSTYTYCARPGTGGVIRHKIGNCPLAKEKP